MSMMTDKTMLAAGLVFILLSGGLSVLSTGGVEDAVLEATKTTPLDNICANDDCTELESDWVTSTADRDFYGWTVTNLDDVMANGTAPTHEKIGPVTYTITSDRTFVSRDSTAGTITYHENTSYACSVDTVVPCDVEITQLNIGFTPQVIGATGMAINGIMDLTKVGFAAQMINQDMNTTQAGTATVSDICAAGGISIPCDGAMGMNWAMGAYAAWMASDTGAGITGANAANGDTLPTADFPDGTLDMAMSGTMHPADPAFNISLENPLGVVAFMGLGAPETMLSDVTADPANSTVMARAMTYGYNATMMFDHDGISTTDDIEVPDMAQTFVRDWALYAAIGTSFAGYGGGADFNASNNDDITSRLHNLLGADFTGANGIALMVAGHLTDTPTGLIATNADATGFGLAAFLTMEVPDAMAAFNLTVEQYTAVATWAGGWATSATSVQLGLLGGVGTMNAEQFVNQTFGGMSPVGDPYLTNSLNMGGAWGAGMIPGHADATPVSITQAQAGNMLYGPLGLTTSTGATLFLYGELSGMTPPVNLMTMEPAAPMTWNASTIGLLYGVDENTAEAMSLFVSSPIFADFVPGFLMSSFGTTPYLTQEFNNWLLGWHDPVSAFLASGNPMDMTVGWTSLESNATFYGSGGIVSDTGTDYMICTGEVSTCDKGEMMAVDGSSYFAWKDPAKTVNTLGLITAESRTGTTGGFLTGSGDMVDLSGYATAAITCDGTSTLKDIAVDDCSASLDPLERPIQAKLLDTDTLLDALPGALPVYFGSEVSLQAEQLSGAIIAGSSESTFWLDMRPITDQHTAPNASHLQAVFMITSSSEIGDADAEDLASSVTTNQKALTYWTNFDVPTDFLAPLLLIGAIACLGLGVKMMGEEDAEASDVTESADEPAADAEESTE
ncbi:CD36 family protein [bacterium]|nr:CD36 family protein [bacterium]